MPIARVADNGPGGGLQSWFETLPIITKHWLGASVAMTLAGNLGIVSPIQLIFTMDIHRNLELWRLLTSFCFAGPFDPSMKALITLYMIATMSRQYEGNTPYNTGAGGGTADYAFALMFGVLVILLTYPLLVGIIVPLFTRNLLFFVIYIWSKRNPEGQTSVWGIPVPAPYFPFVMLALAVVTGTQYMDMLHGIAVGHLYYFLVDVYPQVQGRDILVTPRFLIDMFGVGEYRPQPTPTRAAAAGGGARAPAAADAGAAAAGGGYNWGTGGQRLGGT